MNNNFLIGEQCSLQPFELDNQELIAFVWQWINDAEVTYYMFTGQRPFTKEQTAAMIKKDIEGGNILFSVRDKKSEKPIGYAGLYDIHPIARKAEFRILIGEKKFWGKGYGTEVTELLTYYGFDRLNLHRIYLGFTQANKGAGKAYEKAGYKNEGVLKEDMYRNSAYYDTVRMAILRKNYYENFYPLHKKRFAPSS